MAGGDDVKNEDLKLTGFSKYVNTQTKKGRANVARLGIGMLASIILFFKFKP